MDEVAMYLAAVGVEVETTRVPSNERSMWEPREVAFVPPLATPSVPLNDESERQEPLMAKQPPVRLIPSEPVEVAVRLKRVKSSPPVNVVVAAEPKVAAPVELLSARAETEDVAVGELVAMYKLLAIEGKVQG